MSSVGRGFSPILALHRFLKWCGERGGFEHLRVRQPPPWHGQHCFKDVVSIDARRERF